MKKLILFTSLLSLCYILPAQTLTRNQLRYNFLQSAERRSALDSFSAILDKSPTPLTAAEECYQGICDALHIQYLSGMWAKYKMLDKSRAHINSAIARNPQDPELRFMRFMLEHNIPSFLGMSIHMKDDLNFIFSHTDFLNENIELKKMAMEFIRSSKRCDAAQQMAVESELSSMKKMYAQK